jgi:hypothetical protein
MEGLESKTVVLKYPFRALDGAQHVCLPLANSAGTCPPQAFKIEKRL